LGRCPFFTINGAAAVLSPIVRRIAPTILISSEVLLLIDAQRSEVFRERSLCLFCAELVEKGPAVVFQSGSKPRALFWPQLGDFPRFRIREYFDKCAFLRVVKARLFAFG